MKISVVIPIYNGENYIERCIYSIEKQTYNNWEIILIDDGSTDKTGTICDKYKLKDKRITVIHKVNEGVSSARNLGIKKATGDYITFIDCDDWIEEDFFEKVVYFLENNPIKVLITGFIFDKKGVSKNIFKGKNKKIFFRDEMQIEFFKQNKFSWTVYDKFFKKEIIKNFTFDSRIKIGEDMLFCWQIFNHVERIGYIPLYKYHYDISASNTMTSDFSLKWFDGIKVKKRIYKELKNSSNKIKLLSRMTCIVEMLVLAKKAISSNTYNTKRLVKFLQKYIRKNFYIVFLYPMSNVMTFRQRLGMIYFLLPYKYCKLMNRILKD